MITRQLSLTAKQANRLNAITQHTVRMLAKRLLETTSQGNSGNIRTWTPYIDDMTDHWSFCKAVAEKYKNTPVTFTAQPTYAQHIDDWHEEDGPVLWWRTPIEEPPYVGTPLDDDFDDSFEYWSPIFAPQIPDKKPKP